MSFSKSSSSPSDPWLPEHLVERYGRFLAAAMPWVNRGIAVIPAEGKIPLVKFRAYHHLGAPCPDQSTLFRWAAEYRDANALVLVGQAGLVAVDVDDPSELGWCVNAFGETPLITYSGRSPVNGVRPCHLFYRAEGEIHGTNHLGGRKVDVKAHGGYVVAPGSLHKSGREYRSSLPYEELVDVLESLEDLPRFSRASYEEIWMGARTVERKGGPSDPEAPSSATAGFEDGGELPCGTEVTDAHGRVWALGTVPLGVKFHAPGRADGTPSATVWSPPDSEKRWCFDWSRSVKYYVTDVQCAFDAADLRKRDTYLRRSAAQNAHLWGDGLLIDLPSEVSRLPSTCLGHEESVASMLQGVGRSLGVEVSVENVAADKYISECAPRAREGELTLLVAPHGKGKTVWSAQALAQRSSQRSVVVANTRALAVSAAKTYQSEVYLDSKGSIDSLHVSTTANSIMRIVDTPDSPVETFILDEADQCFDFMHSDRVDQPIAVFHRMMDWLGKAPCAIACSASMSPEHALLFLVGAAKAGRKKFRVIFQSTTANEIEVDEFDFAKFKVELLDHIQRKAAGEIEQPLAIVVTAKKDAKVLSKLIESVGPNLKTWWCSSENSRLAQTREDLSNPDEILKTHDIVVATPALVSGVSFTQGVYKVFCWDKNRKVDSDSVCQLVRRFRHISTGKVVWGRPQWGKESIRYDDEYLDATALGFAQTTEHEIATKVPAITWDSGESRAVFVDPFFAWSWRVAERRKRRSWCNPVKCRYDSFRAYGWKVTTRHTKSDKTVVEESRAFNLQYENAKDERFGETVYAVTNARVIDEEEADTLKKAPEHLPGDAEALERHNIEKFYDQAISRELVEVDCEGKLRKSCKQFARAALVGEGTPEAVAFDDYRSCKGRHKTHYRHKLLKASASAELLSYVFGSDSWSDNTYMHHSVEVEKLRERFKKKVEPHLTYYRELLGINHKVAEDREDRSVQTFNAFCRRLGITITSRKQKDNRVYTYDFTTVKQYCEAELNRVQQAYDDHRAEAAWLKWAAKANALTKSKDLHP